MSYIDLVISGDFTIKKLFKNNGEITEFIKDQKIDEPKKELKGILTEFVTNEFFKTPEQIQNFIKLVCDSYNNVFIEYSKAKGLNNDDIVFVYKGGNIMRFIFKEFLSNYPKHISEQIDSFYSDAFKRSDADFSIYIRPTLSNYEEIYTQVCDLTFLIQNQIRNVFMTKGSDWFDFFRLSKDIQKETLVKYQNKLQESQYAQNYGKVVEGIIFGDIKIGTNSGYAIREDSTKFFDSHEKPTSTTKIDLYKIWEINDSSLSDLAKEQKEAYTNYTGPQMFISANELTFGVSFFNLIRTKWIIDIVFNDRTVITDGELIDVSIIRKEDQYVQHFYDHLEDNIHEYSVGSGLKFKAYSLKYLIQDLEKILFTISEFPWSDNKYEKRIKRLIFFYFVTMLLNKNVESDFSAQKRYIERFKQLLNKANNLGEFKSALLTELHSKDLGLVVQERNPFIFMLTNLGKIVTSKNMDYNEFRKYVETLNLNLDSILNILSHMSMKVQINESGLSQSKVIAGGTKNDPFYAKYLMYKNKYSELKKTFMK